MNFINSKTQAIWFLFLMAVMTVSCSKQKPLEVDSFPTYVEENGAFLSIESPDPGPAPLPAPTISFGIPVAAHVRLALYNATGYEIKLLLEDDLGPGTYNVNYELTNENGSPVKTGIYIIELQIDNQTYLQLNYVLV